jgi:hypothetical protein
MSASSVNSSHAQIISQQLQVSSASVQRKDSDGDNDGSSAAKATAPASTINTQGQTVGTHVNTTA